MSQSSFTYVSQMTRNQQAVIDFFELMKGDKKDTPSVLYRAAMNMLKKYVEHLRVEAGDWWRHENATHAASLWMWYAAYILSGLYAMYGWTFPRFRSGVIEAIEKECDAPPEILKEKAFKDEVLLCTFGKVSKHWIALFRQHTDNDSEFSPTYLCVHGIAYIYALGAAFVREMEDTSDDTLLSKADRLDIAEREKRLGGLKGELESILEKTQF